MPVSLSVHLSIETGTLNMRWSSTRNHCKFLLYSFYITMWDMESELKALRRHYGTTWGSSELLTLIVLTVFYYSAISIGTTCKLFFHNCQLLLYTIRFWFSLALNLFFLILNLKMLLQITIGFKIQGQVASTWG